jgi:uncharacterized protein (TIGR03435 family)
MKRPGKNAGEVVDAHLGLFGSPSEEEMVQAEERAHGRLSSESFHAASASAVQAASLGPAWRWRLAVIAVAAVLLLAVTGIVTVQRRAGTFATVESADGLVYRASDVVYVGTRIGLNETLRSAGITTLALADGSRVEVRSKSQLSLERAADGLSIHLQQGGIIVDAAKQGTGRHLYVRTKDVTVSVVGTVFLVNAEEEGSRVSVIEGEVRVQQGETEKSLRPGQQVTTSPAMKPLPVTEEIAWSRRAPALLAQLQQSTVTPPPPREAFDVISIRKNTAVATGGRGQGGAGTGTRNDPCTSGMDPRIDPVLFDTTNTTVIQLIAWAYGMDCIPFRGLDLVSSVPDWLKTDGYNVRAIRPEGPNDYTTRNEGTSGAIVVKKPGPRIQRMLQTMLAERFGLQMRRDVKEMPVYVLSVARDGPKHTASRPIPAQQLDPNRPGSRMPTAADVNPEFSVWKEGDHPCCQSGGFSEIDGRRKTMADLASSLSAPWIMGRPVLDRTGLKGDFNFYFQFEPRDPNVRPSPEGPYPTTPIFKVLEQVGLELKESKEKVDIWVIDRVERPTEN